SGAPGSLPCPGQALLRCTRQPPVPRTGTPVVHPVASHARDRHSYLPPEESAEPTM
ncbi:hypothetical protein P7K49_033968, partial [Saguinus oedipus]